MPRQLCDVGGSAGTLAMGFLRANPTLRGTVFDLPSNVQLAADLHVLKMILHDWNDEQCRTILGHVSRRLLPGGQCS